MNNRPINEKKAIFLVEIIPAIKAKIKASNIEGTKSNISTVPSTTPSSTSANPSRPVPNVSTNQSTPVSTQYTNFSAHMIGHLLLGMLAPLFIAIAAPMTLILRTLPVPVARKVSHVLRSWPLQILHHPITASIPFPQPPIMTIFSLFL